MLKLVHHDPAANDLATAAKKVANKVEVKPTPKKRLT